MDQKIIKKLNQINQDFYMTIAASFSDSRQFYWQGWHRLTKHLNQLKREKNQIIALDLGCGNARFGQFLFDKVDPNIKYIGLDSSGKLLIHAQEKLEPFEFDKTLEKFDLVDSLIKNNLDTDLIHYQPNLITLFGVLHHIPSLKLRQQLISQLSNVLPPGGLLIFTVWKFMDEERLQKKVVDPQVVGLENLDLEKNDFILDWRRDIYAYRYCHLTDTKEVVQLIKGTDLEIINQLSADGKSQNLNHYYICQKISSTKSN